MKAQNAQIRTAPRGRPTDRPDRRFGSLDQEWNVRAQASERESPRLPIAECWPVESKR